MESSSSGGLHAGALTVVGGHAGIVTAEPNDTLLDSGEGMANGIVVCHAVEPGAREATAPGIPVGIADPGPKPPPNMAGWRNP